MIAPPGSLNAALRQALSEQRNTIGELAILGDGPTFQLCHRDERELAQSEEHALEIRSGADAALELCRFDDQGTYRPLRSAPTLRHGWLLELESLTELRRALDFFYPAALGTWAMSTRSALPVQQLRSKLRRQTGMYRSAHHISKSGAKELVARQCGQGCLKRVLWDIDSGEPSPGREHLANHPGEIPLYCFEPCNLLVAEAKQVSASEHKKKQ